MSVKKKKKKHVVDINDNESGLKEVSDAKDADITKEEALKSTESGNTADLIREVEKYKKLADENFRHFQYCQADLENLKKRAIADRNEMRKYGIIPFAKDILHVVDNLDRALEHLETADKESLTKGIEMTLEEFNRALEQHGITQVPAVGKFFDPNFHEGFVMVETNDYCPNTVIQEFQKGYILDDRLVRPAKVSVSTEPKEKTAGAKEDFAGETVEEETSHETSDEDVEIEIIEE